MTTPDSLFLLILVSNILNVLVTGEERINKTKRFAELHTSDQLNS